MCIIHNNFVPNYPYQDTIHVTQVTIPFQNVEYKFVKKSNVPDVINQLNLFKIDAFKHNLSQIIILLFS